MRRPALSRLTAPAVATAATLLLAGCSDSPADERDERERKSASVRRSAKPAGPNTSPSTNAKPASLDQLADAVGCTAPEVAGKTLDYQQGTCKSSTAEYVLLTFDTAQGQRDWLKVSQMYGGVYLVGNRWVLSASPRSTMEAARDKLGGTIEETGAYDASPSAA